MNLLIKLSKVPFIFLIRGYQLFVSPLFVGHCRYHPTCSQYAAIAIDTHGVMKGVSLIIKRIVRCQPWGSWGFDPEPPASPPASRIQESNRGPGIGNNITPERSQHDLTKKKLFSFIENEI